MITFRALKMTKHSYINNDGYYKKYIKLCHHVTSLDPSLEARVDEAMDDELDRLVLLEAVLQQGVLLLHLQDSLLYRQYLHIQVWSSCSELCRRLYTFRELAMCYILYIPKTMF